MGTTMTLQFLKRRQDMLLALLLGITVFAVYLRTLCPTLYWGDCGELALTAATLGVPHPTGYPLYCLLGKAWITLFPFGSIVWRLNVFSAVFGSFAVTCLYGAARACRLPRPVSLASAGLLAFSSTFWQQCLLTETYTLAAFFTCLLLLLAVRWNANGHRPGDLRLFALVYGFTLTSHQTNTLFLPGFALFILWSEPRLRRLAEPNIRRQWGTTLGLGALPLLLYAYLPLRARAHPAYNWGDAETPFAFFYHVTGRAFAVLMFHQTVPEVLARLLAWAVNLRLEFSWPLVGLAALGVGLFWSRRSERPLALLLTWIVGADLLFVANYSIYNGYIYYIPSYVVINLCIGRGLLGLWQMLDPRMQPDRRPIFAGLGAACVLALVPLQAVGHRNVDLSGNWTCYDYGQNLLASVPPNGILVENGDDTAACAVAYLQIVEGRRPDVILIRRALLGGIYDPHYHTWANAWYLDDLKRHYPRLRELYSQQEISKAQAEQEDPLRRIIRGAAAHHVPVCVLAPAGGPTWFNNLPPFTDDDGKPVALDTYLDRHYDTSPMGLVTRVYKRGHRPTALVLAAETERLWRSYSMRGVFTGKLQRDPFLILLALNYAHGSLARANYAFQQRDYQTAATSYSDVLALFQSRGAAQGLQQCRSASQTAAGPP